MDELNYYYKLLKTTEEKVEKARTKRVIKTILFFSVLYFIAFFFKDSPDGLEVLWTLLTSVFVGGIHFWLNSIVFSSLSTKGEAEKRSIELIENKIKQLKENK